MAVLAYSFGRRTARLPLGFSWTVFLFGMLPSLLRGHWPFLAVQVLVKLIILMYCDSHSGSEHFGVVAEIISQLAFASVRNYYLHQYYYDKGWRVGQPAEIVILNTKPANN